MSLFMKDVLKQVPLPALAQLKLHLSLEPGFLLAELALAWISRSQNNFIFIQVIATVFFRGPTWPPTTSLSSPTSWLPSTNSDSLPATAFTLFNWAKCAPRTFCSILLYPYEHTTCATSKLGLKLLLLLPHRRQSTIIAVS